MLKLLQLVGYTRTVLFIFATLFAIVTWWTGVLPALWRLGNGLARRKIALFARGDNLTSLKALLLDSGLVKSKNIIEIARPEDLGRGDAASLYLVYWHDWAAEIDAILNKKPDKCALIVYSPYDKEKIPTDQMKKLDGKRHTAVTNFRGRLLNDLVASMITTSYEKG